MGKWSLKKSENKVDAWHAIEFGIFFFCNIILKGSSVTFHFVLSLDITELHSLPEFAHSSIPSSSSHACYDLSPSTQKKKSKKNSLSCEGLPLPDDQPKVCLVIIAFLKKHYFVYFQSIQQQSHTH